MSPERRREGRAIRRRRREVRQAQKMLQDVDWVAVSRAFDQFSRAFSDVATVVVQSVVEVVGAWSSFVEQVERDRRQWERDRRQWERLQKARTVVNVDC